MQLITSHDKKYCDGKTNGNLFNLVCTEYRYTAVIAGTCLTWCVQCIDVQL